MAGPNPYYYGYGPGGNVVYSGGNVYMNDVPIATTGRLRRVSRGVGDGTDTD